MEPIGDIAIDVGGKRLLWTRSLVVGIEEPVTVTFRDATIHIRAELGSDARSHVESDPEAATVDITFFYLQPPPDGLLMYYARTLPLALFESSPLEMTVALTATALYVVTYTIMLWERRL